MAGRKSGGKKFMDPMSAEELFKSAVNATENARDLVRDADLLLENQRYPRAFALAELAREELTKPLTLLSTAMQIIRGEKVNWRMLDDHLHFHLVKIEMASILDYMHTSHADLGQGIDDLVKDMIKSGKTNDLKNYSLYASQVDGQPMKPGDLIDAQLATEWVRQAKESQLRMAGLMGVAVSIAGKSGEKLRENMQPVLHHPEVQDLLNWGDRMVAEAGSKDAMMTEDMLRKFLTDPQTQSLLGEYQTGFGQFLQELKRARESAQEGEQNPE